MLQVGDTAPQFSLMNQDEELVSLENYRGKKVLLWFYPKANTPGWTAEGEGLRDEFTTFQAKNVEILGMSADSVKAQKSFCEKKNFPFALLSDETKDTIKAYGAWGLKNFMGREYEGIYRYSYLIDENGTIEKVYSKVNTKTHAKDILSDLDWFLYCINLKGV